VKRVLIKLGNPNLESQKVFFFKESQKVFSPELWREDCEL
jgi:hypothetical protein